MPASQIAASRSNNSSPAMYKPWGISIRKHSTHHLHPSTHESPQLRPNSDSQLSDTQMSRNNRTPSRTRSTAPNESSPLLQNDSSNQPYQPYCATEPPSRVASPDSLTPQPLFLRSSNSRQRRHEPRTVSDYGLAQSPTTRAEGNFTFNVLMDWDKENHQEKSIPNRKVSSRSTMLASADHIARTVTPRGSHSLAAKPTLRYDRTLSQSRVQHKSPAYVAVSPTTQRKPLPRIVKVSTVRCHPLPPIPVEVETIPGVLHPLPPLPVEVEEVSGSPRPLPPLSIEAVEIPDLDISIGQPQHVRYTDDNLEQALQQEQPPPQNSFEDRSLRHPLTINSDAINYQRLEYIDRRLETPVKQVRPRLLFQAELRCPSFPAPRANVANRTSNISHSKLRLLADYVQFPSAPEPYVSRGRLSDMDEDSRAHRRTQPKDTRFQYQLGRRPILTLDLLPPTPPQRVLPRVSYTAISQDIDDDERPSPAPTHVIMPKSSYATPTYTANRDDHPPPPSPLTSFPPFGAHSGPRPPPWGSYEDLEMQRRDRGDARERENARQFRLRAMASRDSESTESLMRREVAEYGEQIRMVYPDMEFDGRAEERAKERDCCRCCVVM
jgi:hypothetical protein